MASPAGGNEVFRALEAIDRLIEDKERLAKTIGLGAYLKRLLGDRAELFKEELSNFDRLAADKKADLLKKIRAELGRLVKPPPINKERKVLPFEFFTRPVEELSFLTKAQKGVLRSAGIKTVLDALHFFPKSYRDRRVLNSVKGVAPNRQLCVRAKVLALKKLPAGDPYNYELVVDAGERLKLKYRFKDPKALWRFKRGSEWIFCGKLKEFAGEKYMVHPEAFEPSSDEVGSIVPVYMVRSKGELKEPVSPRKKKTLARAMREVVRRLAPHFPEFVPYRLLEEHFFPSVDLALLNTHLPPSEENFKALEERKTPWQRRLIYNDLLLFSLAMLLRKRQIKELKAPRVEVKEDFLKEFESHLPFKLTNAQRRVIGEILTDMGREEPMNRLVQGDVGSGKTVVAAAAALAAAPRAGYQVAVMAPTEILARQHYENFRKLLVRSGLLREDRIVLLTGSTPAAEKRKVKRAIASGAAKIVVGTHALVQESVEFKDLALAIVDEQHRFGVLQRKALLEKGRGKMPHFLVMTATPIPRTLALTVYGDLDLSVIDEMPAGRKPVVTKLVAESARKKLVDFVRREIEKGNKVFVIYPLIEESEKLDLRAATEGFESWKKLLPGKKVLLLHGRMKEEQKKKIMEEFKREGDVLVSTTVVEVGVDVPEATVMVIEDAHRFGLAQLHQLRGRVGRGDRPSYCFLTVPDELLAKGNRGTLDRLSIFVKTLDGFKIAEADMLLRGSGNILGTEQSGDQIFPIADLGREEDRRLLEKARRDAEKIIAASPDLERLPTLKKFLLHRYGDRLELGSVS